MQQIQYITVIILTAMLCCGCELSQKKNVDTRAPSADGNAAAGPEKKQQVYFDRLLQDVQKALDNDEDTLAKQLVERGIAQADKAGRDYELQKASFLLFKGKLEKEAGRTNEARRYFADAMAVFRIHKDLSGTFRVNLALASLEENTGDFAAAQRHTDEAKKLLGGIDDQHLHGLFNMTQAEVLASQMKHKEAAALFLEANKIFASVDERKQQANAYLQLASSEDALGESRQCERSLNKAHKIFVSIKDKDGQVRALHRLASLAARNEKYKKARELFKKVEQLYIELDRQSDATKVSQHISALPD